MAGHGDTKILNDPKSPALDIVRQTWEISDEFQSQKFDEYDRAYQDYKGYQDLTNKDPFLAYPRSPLPYAIIESQTAKDIAAVFDKTPWVELKALRPEFRYMSQDFQDAFQCLAEIGDFYEETVPGAKMRRLYGLSYMEVRPHWVTINTVEDKPVYVGDLQVDTVQQPVQIKRFRLKFRAFAPWEVYRDPFAECLETSRWVIKMKLASRREIIKMAERGVFGDKFDVSKLKQKDYYDTAESATKDWGVRMRQNIGLDAPQDDSDVSVWLQFESPDRYIDVWDFRTVLRDQPNPYKHGRVNLTAWVNNYDPNPVMRFDGISEMKAIEQLSEMHSMALAQLVNNHQFSQHKTLLYRHEAVSPDALVMRPGGRIAVTGLLPNMPLDAAVSELKHNPLSPDDYNVPNTLERLMRVGTGVFQDDQGEVNPSVGTATEAALLRQQSDSRKKLTISMLDRQVAKVASLAFSHMDQFMSPLDWANILGPERAMRMEVTHPDHVPGGCQFLFNSADRETERLIKRRDLIDLLGIYGGAGAPMTLQRKLWELYNLSADDIDALEQELLQLQQQAQLAAQAEQQGEMAEFITKKQIGGLINTENKVREVQLGLKALPGSDKRKPATTAKAKRS